MHDDRGRRAETYADAKRFYSSALEIVEKSLEPGDSQVHGDFAKLMEWAETHRTMNVRANADEPTTTSCKCIPKT